jgi:hypothetical protein
MVGSESTVSMLPHRNHVIKHQIKLAKNHIKISTENPWYERESQSNLKAQRYSTWFVQLYEHGNGNSKRCNAVNNETGHTWCMQLQAHETADNTCCAQLRAHAITATTWYKRMCVHEKANTKEIMASLETSATFATAIESPSSWSQRKLTLVVNTP